MRWALAAFEDCQAQEVRNCFQRHGVRYLFPGRSIAILLGFPDSSQDADVFVEKTPENGVALVQALRERNLWSSGLRGIQKDSVIRWGCSA
jgi:hypothetical protein